MLVLRYYLFCMIFILNLSDQMILDDPIYQNFIFMERT